MKERKNRTRGKGGGVVLSISLPKWSEATRREEFEEINPTLSSIYNPGSLSNAGMGEGGKIWGYEGLGSVKVREEEIWGIKATKEDVKA